MKNKISLISFFTILFLLFSSCESNNDDFPPYIYETRIQFVDNLGNNLLKDINIEILENTLKIINLPDEQKVTIAKLACDTIEGELYLIISASSYPQTNRAKKISYALTSKDLFGDEVEHNILTEWEWANNFDNNCNNIFIDNNKLVKSSLEKYPYSFFQFLKE